MKILIADDEVLICEWLEFCIAQNPDYQLVGRAGNGKEALEIFQETEPDLILTDIKMPLMDGIELLRAVKTLRPETVVVLLTAFSEFDLARQAIREGAHDYILKTETNNEGLLAVLKQVETQCRLPNKKAAASQGETWYQHSIIKNILKEKGTLQQEDILRLQNCGVRWRNSGLFALAVWSNRVMEDFSFPKTENVRHVVGFEYENGVYVAVGNLPRDASHMQRISTLSHYVNTIIEQNQCMVGVSQIRENMQQIHQILCQAVAALSHGFYDGRIKQYRWEGEDIHSFAQNESWQEKMKEYTRLFYQTKQQEQVALAAKALDYACENKIYPIHYVKDFCAACMEEVFSSYSSVNAEVSKSVLKQEKIRLEKASNFTQTEEITLRFLAEYCAGSSDFDEAALSPAVAMAVLYIRKHYNMGITLEQIAGEVHLNPEYLSRTFKEEVGCTYTTFLTEIRMRRAAALLAGTNEKVQKIGQEVGYPNVSYFSTLFKKNFGLNPYEYRRQNHS